MQALATLLCNFYVLPNCCCISVIETMFLVISVNVSIIGASVPVIEICILVIEMSERKLQYLDYLSFSPLVRGALLH